MLKKIIKYTKKILSFFYTFIVKAQCAKYKHPLKVNGVSRVTNKTYFGRNVNLNGMVISGCGEVNIGNNFHSGKECLMMTENHDYEGSKIPYDSACICKDIIVEDNVWLGTRVIILGGVTIGEGAIIQAGSVVVNNISKYAIAGGHPAVVFSQRNIEHYERLKKEGAFH